MNLNQAIEALNEGKTVTHDFLEGKSIRKSEQYPVSYGVACGWDDIKDPLHKGDTFYTEYLGPVSIYENGSYLGIGRISFSWVNDNEKRKFPTENWNILER